MAYDDYTSSFEQLLEKDDTTNIHQQNLRILATEMYKVSKTYHPLSLENYSPKKK
jgi:hypothetical protein